MDLRKLFKPKDGETHLELVIKNPYCFVFCFFFSSVFVCLFVSVLGFASVWLVGKCRKWQRIICFIFLPFGFCRNVNICLKFYGDLLKNKLIWFLFVETYSFNLNLVFC